MFRTAQRPGGDAPGAFGSARRSAGQERAVELAVTRREASCKQIAPESNVRIEARVSRRALANHDWHWPRCAAEPLPPHMTLWAAMRSIRSAISLPSIDPPQAHENSASSSLESSKNRCASPTLPLLKPAAYRTLSCAASANGGPGCERYFHSPASRYSRDVNYDPWCPGAGGCQFSVTRRRLSGNQLRSSQFPWG